MKKLCLPLTKTAGCVPKIPILERVHPARSRGAAHHLLQYLSSFFSNSCALFCIFLHSPKTQFFYFLAIPHSLQKKRGGRGGGQVASRKYGTSFCRYILTSLRLYFLFPAETASARRAEYQQWPRVPDTA